MYNDFNRLVDILIEFKSGEAEPYSVALLIENLIVGKIDEAISELKGY